jgi:alpha-galactosidase
MQNQRVDEWRSIREWAAHTLLGENAPAPAHCLASMCPFTLSYDGKPWRQLQPHWQYTRSEPVSADGRERHVISWQEPDHKLQIICELTLFDDFPAIEWVLRLVNTADHDTPIVENIRPLDVKVVVPEQKSVTFHHALGSTGSAEDYAPINAVIDAGQGIAIPGDKISQTFLPYFNLEWQDGGLIGAIGWTGQWALEVHRSENEVTLSAGQQDTHLKLLPGEAIRTPRILLLHWQGADRMRGYNMLRKLLLQHYVPQIDGNPVLPPLSQNTWSLHNEGSETTEQNQLAYIAKMPELGLEAYWLDAGWHEDCNPGYQTGLGSWLPRKEHFPNGLRPVADAAHTAGLKFILWFAPEHVAPDTVIWREHPEWLIEQKDDKWSGGFPTNRLFNLGDPQARQWLTDFLSNCISEWGVDVYRQDRGFYPAGILRAHDAPDRQGIGEIRHVEGLYAMWDELLARHPGLVIDNANWRGTGPDLEMLMRSAGSWTCSEVANCGENSVYNQHHLMGLAYYLPIHASGLFGSDPYTVRSVGYLGTSIGADTVSPDFPVEEMRRASEEIRSLRHLYLGDYYPLIESGVDESRWCGWQFDRADLGEGFAMLFRRPACGEKSQEIALNGLDPSAVYDVSFAETYDISRTSAHTGQALGQLKVEIDAAPGSILIRYKQHNKHADE